MMSRPRIVLPLLALLALPLRAEFLVSEPGIGPNLGTHPVIAATSRGFLAVWTEGTSSRVLRISPAGDPIGLPFENGLPHAWWRSAASNGDQVMVIGDCNFTTTCVGRMSASGELLGTSLVANHGDNHEDARIAWNGEEFLAIYTEEFASGLYWGRYAVKIAPDGSVGERRLLGGADPRAPALATAGGEFFTILRNEANEIVLAQVSGDGVEESRVLSLPFAARAVAIAGTSDGALLIAALESELERLHVRIFRQLDPVSDWIATEGAGDGISLVPSGSGWLIVASSNREAPYFRGIKLTPVSQTGVIGTVQSLTTSFDSLAPETANASGHGAVAVTWTGAFENFGVRLLLAAEDGRVLRAPRTISIGPAIQEAPAALWGGGTILTAWSEVRPDGWFAVKVRAFDLLGNALGPAATVSFDERNQKEPVVSYDGESFFVVWSEGRQTPEAVAGVRVSRDGVVLDPDPIHLFDTTPPDLSTWTVAWDSPDVAWNGTAWVVIAVDAAHRVVGRRISPGGAVLDPVPVVIDTPGTSSVRAEPRIACGSSGCFAAWSRRDWRIGPILRPFLTNREVWSARLGPALEVIAPGPVLLLRYFQTAPPTKVSWNEQVREWVVVTGTGDARRVGADGVPIDEAASEHDDILPSLVPDRDGWRLAWTLLEPFPGGDIFHGWTRTGKLIDVRERWKLTSSLDREADVQLVDAPEPLAFFVRTSNAPHGTKQQIVGRFLVESERIATDLILLASRSDTRTLELSWTTNIEGVQGYALEACYEEGCETGPWRVVSSGFMTSAASFVHERRAGSVRIVALSPSGRIASNAIEFDGAPPRRRPAAR